MCALLDTALEGPVCESTDSFGRHLLPPLRRGDLVAIGQAGAYGASFTSRYNGRPLPAEALLLPDGSLQLCERPPVTRIRPVSRSAPATGTGANTGTDSRLHDSCQQPSPPPTDGLTLRASPAVMKE